MDLFGHNPFCARVPSCSQPPLGRGYADFSDIDSWLGWLDRNWHGPKPDAGDLRVFLSEISLPTDHANFEFNFFLTEHPGRLAQTRAEDHAAVLAASTRSATSGSTTMRCAPDRRQVERGLIERSGRRKPWLRGIREGLSSAARAPRLMPRLGWYLDAAANMRPSQLVNRPRRLIPPRLLAGAAPPEQADGRRRARASASTPRRSPARLRRRTSAACSRRWARRGPSRRRASGSRAGGLLFLFHLHGFADLAAYAAGHSHGGGRRVLERRARRLAARVLDAASAGLASVSNERADHGLVRRTVGRRLGRPALTSTDARQPGVQARVLRRSVEHDIGGNHVLRNAVALVFAGVCLEDPRLDGRALRLLERELDAPGARRRWPRGAQPGLPPRGPRATSRMCRTPASRRRVAGRAMARRDVARMQRWLAAARRPRRRPSPPQRRLGGPGGRTGQRDPSSTCARAATSSLRGRGRLQAVLDVGPSLRRISRRTPTRMCCRSCCGPTVAPLVIDPGVAELQRRRTRPVPRDAAHNTVEVDGVDQCEFWGAFRAAHMPRVRRFAVDQPDDARRRLGRARRLSAAARPRHPPQDVRVDPRRGPRRRRPADRDRATRRRELPASRSGIQSATAAPVGPSGAAARRGRGPDR